MTNAALLIANPRAGGGRFVDGERPGPRLEAVASDLRGAGFDLEVAVTRHAEEAKELAERAREQRLHTVFALGGDGTFREIASSLVGSSVHLGILGGGTTNVLPLSLGLPRLAGPMASALRQSWASARLDVGRLRDGKGREELFLMMVSRGLDARVLAATPPERKRRLGRLGIGLTALEHWVGNAEEAIDVTVDGTQDLARFVAVQNIQHYGGRRRMAPGALPDDGLFDVVSLETSGRLALLRFAAGVLTTTHPRLHDVELRPASVVHFGGCGPGALQVDGDPLTLELPVRVDLLPRAISWLRPKSVE
ncbi:MAG: diacylglycerol kinase family protein [Acidobacteriota bacterium]